MASLFGAFVRGFADQANQDIQSNVAEQQKQQDASDAEKRKYADSVNLEDHKIAATAAMQQRVKQQAQADKKSSADQDLQDKMNSLRGDVRGATSAPQNNNINTQVAGAMPTGAPTAPGSTDGAVQAMTGYDNAAQAASAGGTDPAQVAAGPGQASGIQNAAVAGATQSGPVPPVGPPAQIPVGTQAQIPQGTPSAGAMPTPQMPDAAASSPEAAHVQDGQTNNSSMTAGNPVTGDISRPQPQPDKQFAQSTSKYGLPAMNWIALDPVKWQSDNIATKLSSLGVDTANADNINFYTSAPSRTAVLTDQELKQYARIPDSNEKGQQDFLNNSPNVRAYNVAHNLTTDGQPLPTPALPKPSALLWDATLNRPNGTLDSQNKYYEKADDAINNPKSVAYSDIVTPAEGARQKLPNLQEQQALQNFVISGPNDKAQEYVAKVAAATNIDTQTAAMNDLANHITGLEKRDLFSNTKGRVTNQEAQQFFTAVPSLMQSSAGRQAIISYMTAQTAQDLEVARLKGQYRDDNNGLYDTAHANQLAQQYLAANPVFSGTIDPANPAAMFNQKVMSSTNWLNAQAGKPLGPDSLRSTIGLDGGPLTQQQAATTQKTQDVHAKASALLDSLK